ncbi:MAG TPA: adenylate/guanylate cyclase domain-containing protein, partial [Leptospiraceae bacterium]|nr:adenylate/guanylate cyclase domain-containing protein [Leptospiraceae bacterium]
SFLMDSRQVYSNPKLHFSEKVIIVQIDNSTIQKFSWPMPRDSYADVLQHIASGKPSSILFNIFFTAKKKEEKGDLEKITQEIPNLSHQVHLDISPSKDDINSIPHLEKFSVSHIEEAESVKIYNSAELPAAEILNAAHHIHTTQEDFDKDGVVRSYPLLKEYNGKIYPSLAFQAVQMLEENSRIRHSSETLSIIYPVGKKRIPLKNGELILSLYPRKLFSDSDNPQIISFLKIMESLQEGKPMDISIFKDRIVLIVITGTGSGDSKNLAYGTVPEAWVHATAISNILQEHYIREIHPLFSYILILFLILISAYILLFTKKNKTKVIVPVIFLIIVPTFLFYSFHWNISFHISSFLIAGLSYFGLHISYYIFIEGNEKRQYSRVLSNMIDPFIVDEALKDLESLKAGSEKEITAFFSDIAGFSNISEKLSPKDLSLFLNEYLSAMTEILKQNKGTLDKYIGDAIVGIFGAPVHSENHYLTAAYASLEMLQALEQIKARWKEENRFFESVWNMKIRIGINTGIAKVGFMGTEKIASYTMIGDSVNLAARLESAAKDYGVSILISEFTKERIDKEIFTRLLDRIIVKGKTEPISVFEMVGFPAEISSQNIESAKLYESAFLLYQERKWDLALKRLKESQRVRQKPDKAAELLSERCRAYKLKPPSKDWDGVFKRENK